MKILLLAGEESGMLYARGLRARLAGHDVRGYQDCGFETADLAVMGFIPVLMRLPFLLRVKRTMERVIEEWRPDVVCTIDYPGMNLKLAAFAKARGIRAVHVVCPQVWAWHQDRIPKIEASLDALCCFFPFEPALFKPGFATFVGHPLAKEFSCAKACRPASNGNPLVAILPGSRTGEIVKIFPTLLEVADRMKGAKFAVPAANRKAHALITKLVERHGACDRVEVQLGGARELLGSAECAVVASGTATLEAALARCPTVLVYRVGPLLAAIARRVIKGTKYIGLANIIWERCQGEGDSPPMPELLQEDFTADSVAAILTKWLADAEERKKVSERLDKTVRRIDSPGEPLEKIVGIITQS